MTFQADATNQPVITLTTDVATAQERLTRRSGFQEPALSPGAQQGIRRVFGADLTAIEAVDRILADVQQRGDAAVRDFTRKIDGVDLPSFEVPRTAWRAALDNTPSELREALFTARDRIAAFHQKQVRTSWIDFSDDGALGQIVRPLERIGVYAPGGSAVYPSSLLMTAVPARVAGVAEIIVCTPPTGGAVSPLLLAAAEVAGVDRVFGIGGAQAIAAMAYGTESVPHVDKIFGPGNLFVVLAKKRVFGAVAIDQLPGPTETLVIADETASPAITAADLLAQAEHDPMASAILLTTSFNLAQEVIAQLTEQLSNLDRREIAAASLRQNGLIAVVPDLETATDLANLYAPEHLCLLVRNPWELVPSIKHAGGIFIGEDSPEALGDYTAGPSHVMPTGGTARFFSPIHTADFTRVISVAGVNRAALERLGPATIALARAEGLTGHARAIEIRLGID